MITDFLRRHKFAPWSSRETLWKRQYEILIIAQKALLIQFLTVKLLLNNFSIWDQKFQIYLCFFTLKFLIPVIVISNFHFGMYLDEISLLPRAWFWRGSSKLRRQSNWLWNETFWGKTIDDFSIDLKGKNVSKMLIVEESEKCKRTFCSWLDFRNNLSVIQWYK